MTLTKQTGILPLVCGVSYAYKEDIALYVKTRNQLSITFASGKAWIPVYGTPSSMTFGEIPERTPAGIIYKQEVKLQYPGNDQDAAESFEDLERRPLLVKVTYNNGDERVIGQPDVPARMLAGFESTDKSVYSVSFICPDIARAPFL